MASLIYNSFHRDVATGAIDCDTDTFKVLLVTSTYSPDKDTHDKRDDITNEVTGTGYTAGGETTAVTVTLDTANDKTTIQFGAVSWTSSTIAGARGAVYYKSRGGASSADELVAYNDFGSDVSTTSGTLSLAATTITLQN